MPALRPTILRRVVDVAAAIVIVIVVMVALLVIAGYLYIKAQVFERKA